MSSRTLFSRSSVFTRWMSASVFAAPSTGTMRRRALVMTPCVSSGFSSESIGCLERILQSQLDVSPINGGVGTLPVWDEFWDAWAPS